MNYIERAYKILCTKINVEHELTMLYVLLRNTVDCSIRRCKDFAITY